MGKQPNRAKAIFLEAVEEHAPERWAAFLEQACAGDVLVHAEVEKLLRAQAAVGPVPDAPGSTLLATVDHTNGTSLTRKWLHGNGLR